MSTFADWILLITNDLERKGDTFVSNRQLRNMIHRLNTFNSEQIALYKKQIDQLKEYLSDIYANRANASTECSKILEFFKAIPGIPGIMYQPTTRRFIGQKLQEGSFEYEILYPLIMNVIIASTGYDSQFTLPVQELYNACDAVPSAAAILELKKILEAGGWTSAGFQTTPNKQLICEYLQSII